MTSGDLAKTTSDALLRWPDPDSKRYSADPVLYSRFPLQLHVPPVGLSNEPAEDDSPAGALPVSFDGPYFDPAINVIAPYVDRVFYLQTYPDIAKGGIDPAVHYAGFGWREGRSPNPWFDTEYYMSANVDVRNQDINPFWHYLVAGQHEGRRTRGGNDFRRNLLANIVPSADRPAYDALPPKVRYLDAAGLLSLLETATETLSGMVISVSHDRYVDNVGGTQIFIADEESKFAGNRFLYFHISPAVARLALAPKGESVGLQVVLDGEFVGVASQDVVVAAIGALRTDHIGARIFIVHSLLGHDTDGLAAVAEAFQPTDSFFWLHDYSSLCEGFNLLRNDIAFCGAPPASSQGCRICCYGSERSRHAHRVLGLFERVPFHIVAPSAAALEIWLAGSELPHLDARVHEHAQLTGGSLAPAERPRTLESGPARIAFVGQRAFQKGYPFFREVVTRTQGSAEYRFFHFATPDTSVPAFGVTHVPVSVTPDNPRAMANALRQHDIDLVLVLSPWPETFSYVTYEAFAAGADVVAFAGGGNVPRAVRSQNRGIVLSDENALYEAFTGGAIVSYVRQQRAAGKPCGALEFCGTTATLPMPGPPVDGHGRSGAKHTHHPALRAAAAGQLIDPAEVASDTYRFHLKPDCASVRILSRSVDQVWSPSRAMDTRRLGVAVTSVSLDGETVPLGDPRLGGGWYPPEGHIRWTDGSATVVTSGARILEISVVPSIAYWRADLCDATRQAAPNNKARKTVTPLPPDEVVPMNIGLASDGVIPGAGRPEAKQRPSGSQVTIKMRKPATKPKNKASPGRVSSLKQPSKPRGR
jgi:hypothetical protein